MDRRKFLKSLAGLGISTNLSAPMGKASKGAVDTAWEAARRRPVIFEVTNERGTLVVAGMPDPRTRSDLYHIDTSSLGSLEQVLQEANSCWPLREYLGNRYCVDHELDCVEVDDEAFEDLDFKRQQ